MQREKRTRNRLQIYIPTSSLSEHYSWDDLIAELQVNEDSSCKILIYCTGWRSYGDRLKAPVLQVVWVAKQFPLNKEATNFDFPVNTDLFITEILSF